MSAEVECISSIKLKCHTVKSVRDLVPTQHLIMLKYQNWLYSVQVFGLGDIYLQFPLSLCLSSPIALCVPHVFLETSNKALI